MAQANGTVSNLDMCNASLNAEFEPDERLAKMYRNEQEYPDQKLQRWLGHTNLSLIDDGAKLKKQQFHAKLELERRQKERVRSSNWLQQVDLYWSNSTWSNSFSTTTWRRLHAIALSLQWRCNENCCMLQAHGNQEAYDKVQQWVLLTQQHGLPCTALQHTTGVHLKSVDTSLQQLTRNEKLKRSRDFSDDAESTQVQC